MFSPEFHNAWEQLLAFRNEWVEAVVPAVDGGAKNDDRPSQKVQVLGLDQTGGLRLRTQTGHIFSLKDNEFRLRGVH